MKLSRKILFTVTIIFLVMGCETKYNFPIQKPKNVHIAKISLLVKSFNDYWDARSKGDYKRTYKYELPYQRYLQKFDTYKDLLGLYRGYKAKIGKIFFTSNNEALVDRVMMKGKHVLYRKDKWIYVNGKWYHKFFQTILPPSDLKEADYQ